MCHYPPSDVGAAVVIEVEKDEEDSEKKDEMDDDTMFTGLGEDDKSKPSVAPRWVTRVFAADCLCRIILLCENDKAHFDLAAARSAQAKNPKGAIGHAARMIYATCDQGLCSKCIFLSNLPILKPLLTMSVQNIFFSVNQLSNCLLIATCLVCLFFVTSQAGQVSAVE